MDAKTLLLTEKLELCLKEAAALATANQQIEQGDRIPHFDEIDQPAHQLGKRLRSLI